MAVSKAVFAELAPLYRSAGFWPRPVRRGTKAPPFQKWNVPDPERKLGELDGWSETYGSWGIGLVLGSPFPDGSKLAAIDIDRDDYVHATVALLRNPVCGRVGAKGIAYLVRLKGNGKYRPLKVRGDDGYKVGEILCDNRFLVLPPTIHPETKKSYRWVGKPLLEVGYLDLPLVEASE
ncbi:bifunctional DNA primase/polymerase-like protein [Ochrobactrum sp. BH3]|nr:bifunctional DNA primase/polymerase-like protein [Ochrobactrum sp. BH3]